MEWVETTGKTVAEALELALDRLGVAEDDAEYEVVEEPRSGLFGRVRGEARVRARIRPTAVRPKQDRRSRGRTKARGERDGGAPVAAAASSDVASATSEPETADAASARSPREPREGRDQRARRAKPQRKEQSMDAEGDTGAHDEVVSDVAPEAVGEAASDFMNGLVAAFGSTGSSTVHVDGTEIDVRVDGSDLGLLIGPGGRTLLAVQDLARVASQRRLGDHDTRLRIDVAGYRERRRAALEKFAIAVADEVLESGRSKALEPMLSADRKVVHDVIQGIEGVESHSDGEEPRRRVVITPA